MGVGVGVGVGKEGGLIADFRLVSGRGGGLDGRTLGERLLDERVRGGGFDDKLLSLSSPPLSW